MASEENRKTAFESFKWANNMHVEAGDISDQDRQILDKLADVVEAQVRVLPNLSDGEVMALLTLAQKFGAALAGVVDSECDKKTAVAKSYRQQVAPILRDLILNEVIDVKHLPGSVQRELDGILSQRAAQQAASAV